MRLRLITFNVCHDYPRQRHSERRLEVLADTLAAERPDVVLLQEMFVSRVLGDWTERLAAALRDRGLPYESFYAPANGSIVENGEFEEGGAILSRFPIIDTETRALAPSHEVRRTIQGYDFVERRIALRTTLNCGNGLTIDVFNAHVTDLQSEPSARAVQIDDLGKFVGERPARTFPEIVGGDLNATPDSEEIERLKNAGFIDVFEGQEAILTSASRGRDIEDPRDTTDRRIDYLFVSGDRAAEVIVHDKRVLFGSVVQMSEGATCWVSDHNGLCLDLSFPGR